MWGPKWLDWKNSSYREGFVSRRNNVDFLAVDVAQQRRQLGGVRTGRQNFLHAQLRQFFVWTCGECGWQTWTVYEPPTPALCMEMHIDGSGGGDCIIAAWLQRFGASPFIPIRIEFVAFAWRIQWVSTAGAPVHREDVTRIVTRPKIGWTPPAIECDQNLVIFNGTDRCHTNHVRILLVDGLQFMANLRMNKRVSINPFTAKNMRFGSTNPGILWTCLFSVSVVRAGKPGPGPKWHFSIASPETFAIHWRFLCSSTAVATCRRDVRSGRFHGFPSSQPNARNRFDCHCHPDVSESAIRPPVSPSQCTWRSRNVDREPQVSYLLRSNSVAGQLPAWNTLLGRLRCFSPAKRKQ